MATDEITVTIPPVRAFARVEADKAHALKPLEEAAEVFAAWQGGMDYCSQDVRCATCLDGHPAYEMYGHGYCDKHDAMVDECCDVIQATCNLLAALGVDDLTEAMAACERRNKERGRYGDR